MKKIIQKMMMISFICCLLTGCLGNEKYEKELFSINYKIRENQNLFASLSPIYKTIDETTKEEKKLDLAHAIFNNDIKINDLTKQLDYVKKVDNGNSKLYHYSHKKKNFGENDFYLLVCDSKDNIHDIYIAKYKQNIISRCSIKINENKKIITQIDKTTLTKTGATFVIEDHNEKRNLYEKDYKLQIFKNNKWQDLKLKQEKESSNTSYVVDENKQLKFEVNWKDDYGVLEKGQYRLLRKFSEVGEGGINYIATEFQIK